ncbi:hypothetical protein DFJ74DRAFT_697207 [Hyaloraphidium curvatum]|nr:hypothetical protein DFJ74DRAFT_697207 [Hyaloraphidium curvatum]
MGGRTPFEVHQLDGHGLASAPVEAGVANCPVRTATATATKTPTPLPLGSISGRVFVDAIGRPGVVGVAIKLTGTAADGTAVILATSTSADGSYSFADLPAGTYTLTESVPAGYSPSPNFPNTVITPVVLAPGASSTENDFGLVQPIASSSTAAARSTSKTKTLTATTSIAQSSTASPTTTGLPLGTISGRVFLDATGNPGVAGVTIQLAGTASDGSAIGLSTITSADGGYSFPNLPGGTYAITELVPAGYSPSPNFPNTVVAPVVLAPGGSSAGNDFGLVQSTSSSTAAAATSTWQTESATATSSESQSWTATTSESASRTGTTSESRSLTASTSETQSETATASETQSLAATSSETASATATSPESQTLTASTSETQSRTATTSESQSVTASSSSETKSGTATASETQSLTATSSETASATATTSESQTLTASTSETQSRTATTSESQSVTASSSSETATTSESASASATTSESRSATATTSETASPTATTSESQSLTVTTQATSVRGSLGSAEAAADELADPTIDVDGRPDHLEPALRIDLGPGVPRCPRPARRRRGHHPARGHGIGRQPRELVHDHRGGRKLFLPKPSGWNLHRD